MVSEPRRWRFGTKTACCPKLPRNQVARNQVLSIPGARAREEESNHIKQTPRGAPTRSHALPEEGAWVPVAARAPTRRAESRRVISLACTRPTRGGRKKVSGGGACKARACRVSVPRRQHVATRQQRDATCLPRQPDAGGMIQCFAATVQPQI